MEYQNHYIPVTNKFGESKMFELLKSHFETGLKAIKSEIARFEMGIEQLKNEVVMFEKGLDFIDSIKMQELAPPPADTLKPEEPLRRYDLKQACKFKQVKYSSVKPLRKLQPKGGVPDWTDRNVRYWSYESVAEWADLHDGNRFAYLNKYKNTATDTQSL